MTDPTDTPANWDTVRSGPVDAKQTALLLPGGWCTAVSYQELMAEPALVGVRLIAVTLPGNGGTPAPADLSMENYARMTAQLADQIRAAVVVGHSWGANVALEMVGSGAFSGPVVLLAPSFSRQDEAMIIRVVDRIARVLGNAPYAMLRGMLRFAIKGSPLSAERLAVLFAELQKNDPAFMRQGIRLYLKYLDRHGSVAGRLGAAGAPAWVVHGETGDGGITGDERRTLQAYPWVRMVTIPGNSFFTASEEPALVAGLVIEALHVAAAESAAS